MKRLNLPHDLFELLPTEKVLASELMEGDVAQLHNRWGFVLSSELDGSNNNGYNQEIEIMSGGTAYYPPAHEVNIIPRSIVDKEKVKEMIAQYRLEEAESKRWRQEEEEEERQRLRDMRDELNRELGED